MTLQARDKRALIALGVALLLALMIWISDNRSTTAAPNVVAPADTIEHAQKRLTNLERQAATLNGKQAVFEQASAELAEREKGLISGDTPEQAQAQLLQILRRVAKDQSPPLEMKQAEFAQPQAYGDAYGAVSVSVTIECRIDELINYLAAINALPELIATDEIRIGQSNQKLKTMPVRLTMLGVVARRLIPEKKGPSQL